MFQGHKLNEYIDNESKGTIIHKETFPDFIVEWISPNQIHLYSEKTPSKVVRTVTTRLGFRKCKFLSLENNKGNGKALSYLFTF